MNNVLLQRLKKKLQSRSINSVKSMYPEEVMDMIECYDSQAMYFIEWMNKERLIKYVYIIKCVCGENISIYENRLLNTKNEIYCAMCGNLLEREEIQKQGQLRYYLDKEAIMNYCIDDDVIQWKKREYKQNIIPIRLSEKVEEIKMERKKIFIGSSKESESCMTTIAALIDSLGSESRPWNSLTNPVFVAGNYTLDSLLEVADDVDGAIFIFSADDKTWYTKHLKEENTVRDNVLLEYGLFCGKKGRKKVAFVCKNNPRIASDLLGITYIDGNGSESQIKLELSSWLKQC